jgi:hypothetical protein
VHFLQKYLAIIGMVSFHNFVENSTGKLYNIDNKRKRGDL